MIFLGDSVSNQQGDSLVGMLGWSPDWLPLGGPRNGKQVPSSCATGNDARTVGEANTWWPRLQTNLGLRVALFRSTVVPHRDRDVKLYWMSGPPTRQRRNTDCSVRGDELHAMGHGGDITATASGKHGFAARKHSNFCRRALRSTYRQAGRKRNENHASHVDYPFSYFMQAAATLLSHPTGLTKRKTEGGVFVALAPRSTFWVSHTVWPYRMHSK